MTKEERQKEKELLLKYLSAILPYGVICHYNCVIRCDTMEIKKANCVGKLEGIIPFNDHIGFMVGGDRVNALFDDIKPYLRPMSSMTEEEKSYYKDRWFEGYHAKYGDDMVSELEIPSYIDWLNKNMFDYRGLIPMGLALEAPEDMYKEELL